MNTTCKAAAVSLCPEDIYWFICIEVAIVSLVPSPKSAFIKLMGVLVMKLMQVSNAWYF